MNVYLASPFFNEEERRLVKDLESLVSLEGFTVYSPSRDGIVLNRESSVEDQKRAFDENCRAMKDSDLIIANINEHQDKDACINAGLFRLETTATGWTQEIREYFISALRAKAGKDSGTILEIGYCFAMGKPIILFTDQHKPINVMLNFSAVAYARSKEELTTILRAVKVVGDPRAVQFQPNFEEVY